MVVISGGGCPVEGVNVRPKSGNRPLLCAVNEPDRVALDDGVPPAGAVVLNEFTSAVPDRLDTPSETTCAAKFSMPSKVWARKFEAYLPLKMAEGIGGATVCSRATPAPEGPEVPEDPPSSSMS